MVGKPMINDSLPSNFAGMSKNELYDVMSRMKILIEQNQQQARQILIDNPALTKALFQAQIMLGMVQSPLVVPTVQQPVSQAPQQSVQPTQPPNIQTQSTPVQVIQQDQASATDIQISTRKQQPNHPMPTLPPDQASATDIQISTRKQQPNHPMPTLPPASVPSVTHQSQTMSSNSLQKQSKGHMGTQGIPMAHPQSSQVHSTPPQPHHSAQQQPSLCQPKLASVSSQSQKSLCSSGGQHHPGQPPLPPRPMQPFQHQHHSQMGSHMSFHSSGPSQPHLSQPPFNIVQAGNRHPGNVGFPQGQHPMPNQRPPQPLYQAGGFRLGTDFGNQRGGPMHMDRPPWMSGPPENSIGGSQHIGPPPLPGQMGIGGQPLHLPQLTPEMERTLLQQVMSLTPEQVNLLPPEQRHQVFQLQQMMRQ